jgi:hypothetical protein
MWVGRKERTYQKSEKAPTAIDSSQLTTIEESHKLQAVREPTLKINNQGSS